MGNRTSQKDQKKSKKGEKVVNIYPYGLSEKTRQPMYRKGDCLISLEKTDKTKAARFQ